MDSTIIVALISGGVAFLGSLLAFITNERIRKDKALEEHHKALNEMKKTLVEQMEFMRKEYLKRIDDVENSITDMKATYQQTTAVTELKIDALEKAQNKHNNLIERMYHCEADLSVQCEQIKVANHRIEDLERSKA